MKELRSLVGNRPIILPASVVLIFNESNQILLQRRGGDGKWGVPGGCMEIGESYEETAIREVEEETGLRIVSMELYHVYSGKEYLNVYPNGDQAYNALAAFVSYEYEGKLIESNDESLELRYFDLDTLPEMSLISKKVVNHFKENKKMTHKIIDRLEELTPFIESLITLEEETWFTPISEGKWRIHDIITHIMKWDEYFNETTFSSVNQSGSPELKEHPDYLGYNDQSIKYGLDKTKTEIIVETLKNRKRMISSLKKMEDNKFLHVFPGDRGFTLETYLEEFFTSHDKYHMKQIEKFIANL